MARNRRWASVRGLFSLVMAAVLVWSLVGCGDRIETPQTPNTNKAAKTQLAGTLSEVAPPLVIQQLSQSLEAYQPQVTIVSPAADEVLQDTKVSVQFQVQDLPLFKDPDLGLGPHLQVILDNQPYQEVYDLSQPLVFEELSPGTHTLRVFASRPWNESFKNEGAYAQTTFHLFTKTSDHNPDPTLPLLTYSLPTGKYGAEPIMLDFYLTNAPLHLVAQENPDDEIADWRIRVTANGQSFVLDRWQPVYLKGFKPGKNWVQLEFLDEQGNPVKNVFNNTVRLINYDPKGKDTLSKLVRGELSVEAAGGIVDPNFKVETIPTRLPVETPVPSPSPTVTPTPTPSVAPSVEETPTPKPSVAPSVEETPTPEPATPEEQPTPLTEPAPTETKQTETKQTEKPKSGGFFNRSRRPIEVPSPSPELVVPEESEPTPEPEASATPSEPPASVEEPTEEPTPAAEALPKEAPPPKKSIFGGFFNRFRRFPGAPKVSPELPEKLEVPSEKPTVVPSQPESELEITPEPEELVIPSEPPASEEEPTTAAEPVKPELEPAPVIKPVPVTPIQPEKPKSKGFLDRFQRPSADQTTPNSGLPPTLPEIVETPVPKPSPAEAVFPQPEPSSVPEQEPSSATPKKATPTLESLTDKTPAATK